MDQWLGRIEKILWPDGPCQNVWMIVDGARSIDVFRFLLECYLEYSCLYSGPLTPDLEIAAPCSPSRGGSRHGRLIVTGGCLLLAILLATEDLGG